MEFGNIESILTITFLVIGAIATAAAWIIARIPTRRQVDEMRAALEAALLNNKLSIHDKIEKARVAISKDVEHQIEIFNKDIEGDLGILREQIKKND